MDTLSRYPSRARVLEAQEGGGGGGGGRGVLSPRNFNPLRSNSSTNGYVDAVSPRRWVRWEGDGARDRVQPSKHLNFLPVEEELITTYVDRARHEVGQECKESKEVSHAREVLGGGGESCKSVEGNRKEKHDVSRFVEAQALNQVDIICCCSGSNIL